MTESSAPANDANNPGSPDGGFVNNEADTTRRENEERERREQEREQARGYGRKGRGLFRRSGSRGSDTSKRAIGPGSKALMFFAVMIAGAVGWFGAKAGDVPAVGTGTTNVRDLGTGCVLDADTLEPNRELAQGSCDQRPVDRDGRPAQEKLGSVERPDVAGSRGGEPTSVPTPEAPSRSIGLGIGL